VCLIHKESVPSPIPEMFKFISFQMLPPSSHIKDGFVDLCQLEQLHFCQIEDQLLILLAC
jgi:hypothetical protein